MARREFDTDSPYQALLFTAERNPGLIPGEGRILLLNPRAHSALALFPPERSDCVTPERLDCERLEKRGYKVLGEVPPGSSYALTVAFPGESKDEALYLLALAARSTTSGGTVLATMSNDLGASRFESKLEELLGTVQSQSKNRCRVFWAANGGLNEPLMAEWLAAGAPRKVIGTELWTVPGLFSWNKVDKGSESLARALPADIKGIGADLGCGYGYLASELLSRCPGVSSLTLFDSDRRAIEMARRNLGERRSVSFEWRDIQSGMPKESFDFIIMNPPFHEYATLKVELGKRFFRTAHEMLKPGCSLFAVVNRHLPYDETLWGIFPQLTELSNEGGYRVLRAVK